MNKNKVWKTIVGILSMIDKPKDVQDTEAFAQLIQQKGKTRAFPLISVGGVIILFFFHNCNIKQHVFVGEAHTQTYCHPQTQKRQLLALDRIQILYHIAGGYIRTGQ